MKRTPAALFPPGAAPEPGSAHERYVATRLAESGRWGHETVGALVARHARERPAQPAFIDGATTLTWEEYDARAASLAASLVAAGLQPGDRLAVFHPDGAAVHVVFVAAERAGVVVVGIGPRAGRAEIEHLIDVTGAVALLTVAPADPAVAALAGDRRLRLLEVAPDGTLLADGAAVPELSASDRVALLQGRGLGTGDLFLINSTSGTTGLPKCVTHTQDRWRYFHELAVDAGELGPDDVMMSLISAPFGFGLWTAHVTPAVLGVPTVLQDRFAAEEAIAAIERHRVTVLACVSTQFIMMLNSPALDRHDLTPLRAMFTGGEAVPHARGVEFEARTGAAVLQFYGSNETGALSRTTLRDTPEQRLTTAGRIIDGMQVRVIDAGGREVTGPTRRGQAVCAGPATCLGYFADPEANRLLLPDAGTMLTGDLVEIDAAGYLRVVGRTSDVIIRGGKNVSATVVEQAVASHPAVALAAAVAMPDPVYGERVCVYVVLRKAGALALDGLVTHLATTGLSKESYPEHLVVVDELPRSSGGKVAKGELRADIRDRLRRLEP